MSSRSAIIIGAGVAGLGLAWWLVRAGWVVAILERAPALRPGGHMLRLSGPGLEVTHKMGLYPALEAAAKDVNENVYRDRNGREVMRIKYRDVLRDLPYLALQRNSLVRVIYDTVKDNVDIRYSSHVTDISQTDHGAEVRLDTGELLSADLLVGADGFRSSIRKMVFGQDAEYFEPLGYRFAVYDIEDGMPMGADFLSYVEPGKLTDYYTLTDRQMAALHVWATPETGPVPPSDRWAVIDEVVTTSHSQVREIIAHAKDEANCRPVVDDLTLVTMPNWSKGRVVLVGDAAHCLTLISGQGVGMALTSAAILAQELDRSSIEEALQNTSDACAPRF